MISTVFVYTMSRTGEVGAWSRYVFPFAIDNFAQFAADLYIRAGDDILRVDDSTGQDFVNDARVQNMDCVVQWPWLDMGQPGVTKLLAGIDVTSNLEEVDVSIGYDQTDPDAFTDPYTADGDTVPGTIIPITVMAPSFSVRLAMDGTTKWQIDSVGAYLQDMRPTA